ncbi:MAG: tetratricopeptide repeat protein [Nitrospiraceae bacterium]
MRKMMWVPVILLAVLSSAPWGASAQESAAELSVKAQKECDLGRRAQERSIRLAHFERGQVLAEQAIALDEQLANAHFALFCSLGEQIRIDGDILSSPLAFRRMMKALDRTLDLNPDHLDALSSKGTFLIRLPVLLGGDAGKGEQMLRRVIQRDPKAVNARLTLAKTYAARGNRQEAIALATTALEIAQAEQLDDLIPEAHAIVGELRPTHAQSAKAQR